MFGIFGKSKPHEKAALDLYASAVRQARLPVFYEDHGVADTPDGRFDMVMLQVYFLLRRLKDGDEECQRLAQQVFDVMFADMDQNLREMGAGDIGVAHRVKDMAKAFYGRIAAYDEGLDADAPETLEAALRRNMYRKIEPNSDTVSRMAAFVKAQSEAAAVWSFDELIAGQVAFIAPLANERENDDE